MGLTSPCVLLLLSALLISGNTQERSKAVVTLHPDLQQIFTGERLTLRCQIQGGENNTEWRYFFKRDDVDIGSSESELKIESVEEFHRGAYTCVGKDTSHEKYSDWSDEVMLTVTDRPQPVLRVSPSWLNPGDSVTLSCEVGDSSTGWSFFFYRAAPSLPDQPYSVELLSDREQTTGNSSTLQLAAPSHTAGYMCRAGRGETVYYSDYSNPQFHWSGDQISSVSLSVSTNRSQHLVSESVSLSCELKGNSTGWTLRRYTGSELYTVCSSVKGSTTGSTCIIRSLNVGHSGVFWCESGSGEYSNAVNITVHGAFKYNVSVRLSSISEGLCICLQIDGGSSQSQSTNLVLDGVQIANQNQAPAGNAPLEHRQGVEAGPSDVTYAQIELKKMKKPKRKTGKQAESEEDTIYSKVAQDLPLVALEQMT
ncbi:Fc receptor-like protein 4 [Osmerus eperlanus]|uniref:Fc receptor-like protein 4 n=1 Tax=Osmerus eperlanus TaxID=29151 RepID=UPI002E156534